MSAQSNIILVGFMGTGKTSVGKLLAQRLNMEFLDMDDVIVEREGKSIPHIFNESGEPYFRMLERKLVEELSKQSGLVIAAGGGIVLNSNNIADFSRTGVVVCLNATPEVILKRVGNDTNRPLLMSNDRMQKIRDLLESRRKLYDAIPLQINTDLQTLEQVVDTILFLYRKTGNK